MRLYPRPFHLSTKWFRQSPERGRRIEAQRTGTTVSGLPALRQRTAEVAGQKWVVKPARVWLYRPSSGVA